VDAPLAARRPLEVLDRIRHPAAVPRDVGVGESAIEQPPGRADERTAGSILVVARLLPDEHDRRVGGAVAPHGLGGVAIERARDTPCGRVAQRGEIAGRRRRGTLDVGGSDERHWRTPEQRSCLVADGARCRIFASRRFLHPPSYNL
jgi:hypothetical protein